MLVTHFSVKQKLNQSFFFFLRNVVLIVYGRGQDSGWTVVRGVSCSSSSSNPTQTQLIGLSLVSSVSCLQNLVRLGRAEAAEKKKKDDESCSFVHTFGWKFLLLFLQVLVFLRSFIFSGRS